MGKGERTTGAAFFPRRGSCALYDILTRFGIETSSGIRLTGRPACQQGDGQQAKARSIISPEYHLDSVTGRRTGVNGPPGIAPLAAVHLRRRIAAVRCLTGRGQVNGHRLVAPTVTTGYDWGISQRAAGRCLGTDAGRRICFRHRGGRPITDVGGPSAGGTFPCASSPVTVRPTLRPAQHQATDAGPVRLTPSVGLMPPRLASRDFVHRARRHATIRRDRPRRPHSVGGCPARSGSLRK
jgi:hypothetical protein